MISIVNWIMFIIGIILSLTCVYNMVIENDEMTKLASFIGGIVYLAL